MCFFLGGWEGGRDKGGGVRFHEASRRGTGSFHRAPEKVESPGKCCREARRHRGCEFTSSGGRRRLQL